jgi:hypothetical protein
MYRSAIAVVLAMPLLAAPVRAPRADTPSLSIDGFGTLGMVHSDEDQADFASSGLVPEGAGHSGDWSAKVDSRVGLQLTALITPRLSGVLQFIAEQRYDDSYKPTLEWANLKFDITPDLSVRAGRIVLPTFLVSEYRKVGYANPWVRPPQEVYGVVPVTSTDGVDLSYRFRVDRFTNTVRAIYGRRDIQVPDGSEANARDALTLADTLEFGSATLFAQYSRARLTLESVNPLFNAFRQFGPPGQAIAERYDVDDTEFHTVSLGARYDPGDWFVMGEYARSRSRSFLGDNRGWYVTGGYRYGAVTPYVTLARVLAHGNTSDPGLPLAGLPPPLAGQAAGLNAALNGLLGGAARQRSVSLGARWDFMRNAALKVQYDHIDIDAGSPGVLSNIQPGFRPGGSVSLFSVALDFVF